MWFSSRRCATRRERASSDAILDKSALQSGATSAAAAVGVGARSSATKSQIVKSVSCPTPLTIGIRESKIACAAWARYEGVSM